MSYQKKMQMLDEANKQTKALSKLGKWLKNIKMISTIFFIISYWGLTGSDLRFVFGVMGLISTIVCIIFAIVVNLGIKNGKRNVEKILGLSALE